MTTRDDVRNGKARFVKAVAERDVKALVDCYEADGIVLAPNTPMVRGSSALGDLFQKDIIDAGSRPSSSTRQT
jgi:ketosteroid isomerase-like protein